jgi:fructokinase
MLNFVSVKNAESMKYLWGVDLGGTKIEGLVLAEESNEIIIRKRVPTEAHLGYDHILDQIKKLINLIADETGIQPQAIGFSTPGTLDPSTQTMKNCNTTAMNGKNLKKDLEELLKVRIELANDANCFALAEATQGAAKGHQVVFGVILGTGVGGGVVVNGKVIPGKHGIGGEWGHNTFDPNGEPCYCGRRGCNELVFAGPALEKYYTNLTGEKVDLKEIYRRYKEDGQQEAGKVVEYLTDSFAKAVGNIINVLDPDAIVFGGGVSHIEELYTDGPEKLKDHIFNNRKVETLFLKPQLGDSAGVFGAIELIRN